MASQIKNCMSVCQSVTIISARDPKIRLKSKKSAGKSAKRAIKERRKVSSENSPSLTFASTFKD